jgi:hypothetical protein
MYAGRAGHDARAHQQARLQRRRLGQAEPDARVEAIADQVAHPIAHGDLDRQLRVLGQELVDARRENELADAAVDVHAQAPAHLGRRAARLDGRVRDGRQVGRDRLVESAPFVGQRDRTGGAAEQAYADPILEARDRPADRGLGQSQRLAGAHEAARLDDRAQDAEAGQRPVIEGHFETYFCACLGVRVCTCRSLKPGAMFSRQPRQSGHSTGARTCVSSSPALRGSSALPSFRN